MSRAVRNLWFSLLLLLCLPGLAAAQSSPLFSAACRPGNLLAGKAPSHILDVHNNPALVTDGAVAPEGAIWNAPVAVTLETAAGALTYDLGAPMPLVALFVQADANDTYRIYGSNSGQPDSFRQIGEVPIAQDVHGLRGRVIRANTDPVRFIRIGEGQGDGYYSISEFQAFCEMPVPFPPQMRIVDAPMAAAPETPAHWWNNDTSARIELTLAIVGAAVLWWGRSLRRAGRPRAHRRLRNWILIALGVTSFGAYFNFGYFHFNNYTHLWDTFHYYVGAKYVRELSYDMLYECTAVADSEGGPDLRRRVELRKITNLHTNILGGTQEILAHPEKCKDHFTPERWEKFKTDIAWFRNQLTARYWDDVMSDHGYNGTPVWAILGSALTNLSPASNLQIKLLNTIDVAMVFGMALLIWWAFGWQVLCVALTVFATIFPSRWYWTGGSILRWDWLFWMVVGVCLVRKDKHFWGGTALAYSALLRLFPAMLFLGPLFALADYWYKHRKLERRYLAFFGGAALCVAVLIPTSFVVNGTPKIYVGFVENTVKHAGTPLTNHMGLRTVLSWRPSTVGRHLRSNQLEDPWLAWKEARLKSFGQLKPLFVLLVVGFLGLLAMASRGADPWVAAVLSSMMIVVIPELTCYYYAFLIVPALLYDRRRDIGELLFWAMVAMQFIAWAPIPGMATWIDEQYTTMSAVCLVATAVMFWWFTPPQLERYRLAEAGVPPGGGGGDKPAVPTDEAAEAGDDKEDAPRRRHGKKRRRRR